MGDNALNNCPNRARRRFVETMIERSSRDNAASHSFWSRRRESMTAATLRCGRAAVLNRGNSRTRVAHKFTIGQVVALAARVQRPAAAGEYQILALVPAFDNDPGDPRYRIKNCVEKHERVACES